MGDKRKMTIEDIKNYKKELERSIFAQVSHFEETTGTRIEHIFVDRTEIYSAGRGDQSVLTNIKIDVTI